MNSEKYYQEILESYPEFVTKDQMYRICHISKRTCLFLLESGAVPNIDSGKKTRRFKIKTVDIIEYMRRRQTEPRYYRVPDGYYSKKGKVPISMNHVFTDGEISKIRLFYDGLLSDYQGSFFDSNEVEKLFQVARGTHLEIPVFLGAFYGLRRSEVLGLKWDAIDFENNTITINHTVTSFNLEGKQMEIEQDTTKTKSSLRTLPLVPTFKERLLAIRDQQDENRRLCGRCYDRRYLDYICVDEMGKRLSPNYLSAAFPRLLEVNGLRHIRFHDLRHSCASLLLANGVPMKQIQEWLGHSDFSTTANIYAHLDYSSKLSSAEAMIAGLSGALNQLS